MEYSQEAPERMAGGTTKSMIDANGFLTFGARVAIPVTPMAARKAD